MDPLTVGLLSLLFWLVLVFLRVPVGIALMLAASIGLWYLEGADRALFYLSHVPYRVATTYTFTVLPAFAFMGQIAAETGFSTDAYNLARAWVGHRRGGLGMATILGCTMMAAIIGSPIATAVTMLAIALPEMRRAGYDDRLSTGCLGTGSILGPMIPPSVFFIVYSFLTEESLGYLFIAGIGPGLMLTVLYLITILIWCKFNPSIAPVASAPASWRERLTKTPHVWAIGLIFLFILGGIYTGFFTPTEAGSMGAFAMVAVALIRRKLTWKIFNRSLLDTGRLIAMLMVLTTGVMVFVPFLAVSRLAPALIELISGFPGGTWGVMAAIMVMYLILGMFMSAFEQIFITVPILFPVVVALGFDPIWFGVILCLLCGIGNLTPPYGVIVFVINGLAPDIGMWKIFRGCIPFLFANLIGLILLSIFPEISLWLVHTMRPG